MSASRPALEAVQALQLQSRCSLHSARLHTARRPGLCDAEALQRHHRLRVRAASASADDLPPAGCERVRLQLRKPLGLVLEMTKSGRCYIVDVLPSGSAAKDGRIVAGDELISTSALVFSRTEDYGGVAVKKGMSRVRLMCFGETLDTITAAIGTHPASELVTIDIQKCEPLVKQSL